METKTKVPKIERNWQIKDRTYILSGGKAPLSWTIQSKHTTRKPLLWFDEELKNEKYGVFRGTGVLTKENNVWKINQYNLILPIPNDLLIKYSKEIKIFLDND